MREQDKKQEIINKVAKQLDVSNDYSVSSEEFQDAVCKQGVSLWLHEASRILRIKRR